MKKVTEKDIKEANKKGLLKAGNGVARWYTPVLQQAYDMGVNGFNIQDCPVVSGYRYGDIPDCGVSNNYADNILEWGLSIAAIDGEEEHKALSMLFMRGREKVAVRGVLLPQKGSDGENLMLPIDIDLLD